LYLSSVTVKSMAQDSHWFRQAARPSEPISIDTVLETFGQVLLGLDRDLRIVHAIGALGELMQTAAAALVGRPITSFLSAEVPESDDLWRGALDRGERSSARVSLIAGDGSTRIASCGIAPYEDSADQVAFVILLQPAGGPGGRAHTVDSDNRSSLMATGRETGQVSLLRAALEQHRWQRQTTARALGISRTTLWRRMRETGLLAEEEEVV
jgi:PAS domain-containing protein